MFADNPLAQGFPLSAGSVQVTVPQAQDRSDYIVARKLFSSLLTTVRRLTLSVVGGSNNISPMFTIAH